MVVLIVVVMVEVVMNGRGKRIADRSCNKTAWHQGCNNDTQNRRCNKDNKNSDTITITKNSNRIMIKRKRGVVNGGEDYVRDDGDCGHRNKRNETTTTTTTTLTDVAEHGDLLDAFEKVIFDVAAEMEQRRVFVLMVTV